MTSLPAGTKITIEYEGPYQKLVIPHKSGGILRVFMAAFLLFWLGGWAFGWVSAAGELARDGGPEKFFLMFWLAGWTVGGIAVCWFLFRLLRPAIPEVLILARPNLVYDSGIAPLQISFGFRSQLDIWKNLFKKRVQTEFAHDELTSLRLREHDEGNRLTIDRGNTRLEIAAGATEIEREWLFEAIRSNYAPL